MSPYLFFYDFTLLAVGAALLGAPRDRFELIARGACLERGAVAGARLSRAAAAVPAGGVAGADRGVQARRKRGASSGASTTARKRAAEAGAGVDIDAARIAGAARNRASACGRGRRAGPSSSVAIRPAARSRRTCRERVHMRISSLQSGNVFGSMPPWTKTMPRASSRSITGSARSQAMCALSMASRQSSRDAVGAHVRGDGFVAAVLGPPIDADRLALVVSVQHQLFVVALDRDALRRFARAAWRARPRARLSGPRSIRSPRKTILCAPLRRTRLRE